MKDGVPDVVVLVDHDPASSEVLEAMRERVAVGPARFCVLMTNPAAHEAHIVHAGRHDAVAALRARLPGIVAAIEGAIGGQVDAEVSIRHEPYDALEELMLVRAVDEVIYSVMRNPLAARLHLDLGHRLAHLQLVVRDASKGRSAAPSG